ncbi:MAG TPA: HAD family hydrolase [Pilimelia sp.]|nr:HAD family hydrolase [Pilimelia sp.]
MSTVRAVLFDFFGTLTDAIRRGPQHTRIAQTLGCDPIEMISVLDRSFHARSRGVLGNATESLRWVCLQAGARPSRDALDRAVAARVAAIAADTRLRADAVPTLRALRRRGLRTALVSDCGHELPAFLPSLPVAPLLDAAVYSVRVGECKPHPAIYRTACRRLGVEPAECLYVGDGGGRELTGAAELGMTAVRLAAPDLAGHLTFNPDRHWTGLTIGSLSEVVGLVDRVPALV